MPYATIPAFTAVVLLLLVIINTIVLWSDTAQSVLFEEWLPRTPGSSEQQVGRHTWRQSLVPASTTVEIDDDHPIRKLMHDADQRFEQYERDRSRTFKETVTRYRYTHGRHPPPGFEQVQLFNLICSDEIE